jgi:hypothetical protein
VSKPTNQENPQKVYDPRMSIKPPLKLYSFEKVFTLYF